MRITKIQHYSTEELLGKIKQVSLMHQPELLIYENAQISLETLTPSAIDPAQRYVLDIELKKVRNLKWELEKNGYNLFELNGYLVIKVEGLAKPITVLPPVVEESLEADGKTYDILNDGMHRVYLARTCLEPIQVLKIKNVPKQFPYYAHPLIKGWDEVEIVHELPEDYIKKWHRVQDYKRLYRDFNSVFDNVGASRGSFRRSKE